MAEALLGNGSASSVQPSSDASEGMRSTSPPCITAEPANKGSHFTAVPSRARGERGAWSISQDGTAQ